MSTSRTTETPELSEALVSELQVLLQGKVIRPGDAEYNPARQVWNTSIDKHPAVIVRCANTADVVQAINFATSNNLPVAIRGGGHGIAGQGVCDQGLVIDLSLMKGIEIDPDARTARFQPGVIGAELGRAAQAHGLALPGGQVPTTGVTSVLLGGGIGWLTRPYGLSCDSLLSTEVVTANGQVLTASATENPDLFWALRGGSGNFGVVTRMLVKLHPVSMVLGGLVAYPIEQTATILQAYRDFAANVPDNFSTTVMFLSVPPAPMFPAHLHGQRVAVIAVCYTGPLDKGHELVGPLRAFGTPILDMIAPMPFSVVQSMGEAGGHLGFRHDIRSSFLGELSDEAIATIAEHVSDLPQPLAQTQIIHLGGAMARVAPDATAFPHRDAQFIFTILPSWMSPAEEASHRDWMLGFAREMEQFASEGVYVNFLGDEGPERVRAAYGANYERLAALKRKYDPNNVFRLNQNIEPA